MHKHHSEKQSKVGDKMALFFIRFKCGTTLVPEQPRFRNDMTLGMRPNPQKRQALNQVRIIDYVFANSAVCVIH